MTKVSPKQCAGCCMARETSQGSWSRNEFLFRRISELFFEIRFHRRPLGIDHAVIHRVPDTAARGDHVIAERAFLLGADAQNGLARTLVQRVRLELDADAAQ